MRIMKRWKYLDESRKAVWSPGPPAEYRLIENEVIQQWLAEGNTPDPPDPEPEPVAPGPSLQERVEAAETIIDLLLMEGE